MQLKILPEAITCIRKFQVPDELPFGHVRCPVTVESDYQRGEWGAPRMAPYRPFQIDPCAKILHYAQGIFEGMKGYRVAGEGPYLFRPGQNQERFNMSAERMAMPTLPAELFHSCVEAILSHCAHIVPTEPGDSLYIRPFMFAGDVDLGIRPSQDFKFMVVASPSQSYFTGGALKILIEREAVRACPGGVGNAKTGGNYAASLQSMVAARKLGLDQVLWLDAVKKKYVEEMSGMNFFVVYGEELVTPKLSSTILNGITRDSLIQLAEHKGWKVCQKDLEIGELVDDIRNQRCTEAFACGTAVVITPIAELREASGESYVLKHASGPVTLELRRHLTGIQEGSLEDPFGWRKLVEAQT